MTDTAPLLIIEKYETFLHYVYPIAQNIERRHGTAFASIDRAVLHAAIRKKITCPRTLALIGRILPADGRGLPIGALTSQLFANVYGNILDHRLHHQLRVPFARYMDDVIVLGHDLAALRAVKDDIETFAADRLHLRLSRWQAAPVSRGINFLGYRIWPHHKLLRRSSVTRAKRRIRALAAAGDSAGLQQFLGSWQGHAAWADTHHLQAWLEREHHLADQLATAPQADPNSLRDLRL